MRKVIEKIGAALRKVREWANDYEPAVARSVLATVVQAAAVAGVSLGDLPQKVDSALVLIGLAATVIAGRSIRKQVTKPATVEWLYRYTDALERGVTEDTRDIAVQVANGESG